MYPTRERAAALGRDTLDVLRRGHYRTPAGTVSIAEALRAAVAGTVDYPADERDPAYPAGGHATAFTVANESTLAAARRLALAGHRVCALNFASARHPGGGFLSGARAQEESLARSSGLFACIDGRPMYAHNARLDGLYSHAAVYSPDVPVFRDDDGELLPEPYPCSFVTCPAVNAGVVLDRDRGRRAEVTAAMRERTARVLAVTAAHGHAHVVLGAWGCGVFKNDAAEVAGLFREAFDGPFRGVFAAAAFAVLDSSAERRFIGPFQRAFGEG